MSAINVTIDGVAIPQVVEDSVRIESIIGQVVDTCDLTIYDKEATINVPTLKDIVITRVGTSERLFAGLVAMISGRPHGPTRYWDLSCQDYTVLLDRTLVIQSYAANFQYDGLIGDKALIASAFEVDAVGAFGTSVRSEIDGRIAVEQGLPVLSQQEFRYSTLREVVSQLAQYVGYDFYVDYEKRLHYYYRETNLAPYELTDGIPSAQALNYRKAVWKRDGTRLVNTFALFGDRLLSDPQAFILEADGATLEFDLSFDTIRTNFPLLPEPGQRTVRVDINAQANLPLTESTHNGVDGTDALVNSAAQFITDGVQVGDVVVNTRDQSWGVIIDVTETQITGQLTQGTTNTWEIGDQAEIPTWIAQRVTNDVIVERENVDVRHDALGKTLRFNDAPPDLQIAIRLRYTYNFVGGQIDTERLSVERYGRVFSRRVVASDVNSAQGLTQKLVHLKEQYADALEIVTVKIDDNMFPSATGPRFQSGQWVTFTNRVLGVVNKSMLIHRILTRVLGGTLLEYELELRDWEVDI